MRKIREFCQRRKRRKKQDFVNMHMATEKYNMHFYKNIQNKQDI